MGLRELTNEELFYVSGGDGGEGGGGDSAGTGNDGAGTGSNGSGTDGGGSTFDGPGVDESAFGPSSFGFDTYGPDKNEGIPGLAPDPGILGESPPEGMTNPDPGINVEAGNPGGSWGGYEGGA